MNEMDALHAASSDWHIFNAGVRDRCQRDLVDATFDRCIEMGVTDLWLLGDVFERMKGSKKEIQKEPKNVSLLRRNAWKCTQNNIRVHLLYGGNHDPECGPEFLPWLRDACGFQRITMHGAIVSPTADDPHDRCGVWTMMHGHQLDETCGGKLAPVAKGVTWFFGNTIERVIPSFPESWANPVGWVAPRTATSERAGAVGEIMRNLAEHNGLHLLAGHTHKHALYGGVNDAGQSWMYANSGACSDNAPFSMVVFRDDGWAQLVSEP